MESAGVTPSTSSAPDTILSGYTASVSPQSFLFNAAAGQLRTWSPSIPFEQSISVAAPELLARITGCRKVVLIDDALQRLREIEGLDPNWDSYGSAPPRRGALAVARGVIWKVYQGSAYTDRPLVPYAVVPLSGGGVQIEWRGVTDAMEVEISAQGVLGYLLVRGTGPTRRFDERDDVAEFQVVEQALSII